MQNFNLSNFLVLVWKRKHWFPLHQCSSSGSAPPIVRGWGACVDVLLRDLHHQLNTRIKTISTQHCHKPNNISNNTIATTKVPGNCSTMSMWISFSVWHRGGLLWWHNLQCCVLGPLTRLYNVHWTPPAPHTHITDTCHAASINWYLSIWIFLWTRHFLIGNNSYVLSSSNTNILLEWRAGFR